MDRSRLTNHAIAQEDLSELQTPEVVAESPEHQSESQLAHHQAIELPTEDQLDSLTLATSDFSVSQLDAKELPSLAAMIEKSEVRETSFQTKLPGQTKIVNNRRVGRQIQTGNGSGTLLDIFVSALARLLHKFDRMLFGDTKAAKGQGQVSRKPNTSVSNKPYSLSKKKKKRLDFKK